MFLSRELPDITAPNHVEVRLQFALFYPHVFFIIPFFNIIKNAEPEKKKRRQLPRMNIVVCRLKRKSHARSRLVYKTNMVNLSNKNSIVYIVIHLIA